MPRSRGRLDLPLEHLLDLRAIVADLLDRLLRSGLRLVGLLYFIRYLVRLTAGDLPSKEGLPAFYAALAEAMKPPIVADAT